MAKRAATNPAVRGSKTGRPIMVLLDLLGRRWTLRILWELRDGALTSRGLRAACGDASPTVVQQRVSELRKARFVEKRDEGGYALTVAGRELLQTLLPLHEFAARWQGGKKDVDQ